MRRRSKPHTFDERLNAEKTRIEAALESAGQGPQRDLLELKLRQIENVLHIDGWLSSAVRL
jgi:phage FluMu protein gp41